MGLLAYGKSSFPFLMSVPSNTTLALLVRTSFYKTDDKWLGGLIIDHDKLTRHSVNIKSFVYRGTGMLEQVCAPYFTITCPWVSTNIWPCNVCWNVFHTCTPASWQAWITERVPSTLTFQKRVRSSQAGDGEAQWNTSDTSFKTLSKA